jgi:uncharacterized coiled-coil DUF342 family protein
MPKTRKGTEKPVEKHPKLRKIFDKLQNDKKALLKKSEPLRKKRDALLERIQPLEAELREVNKAIAKIERPKLSEIDMGISGLAKAMGGKSMSTAPETVPTEE